MSNFWKTYRGFLRAPVTHRAELLSVQWLRGLAVLMVLAVHVEDIVRLIPGFQDFRTFWMDYGYSAPDLFFVISGFIMAYVTFGMKFEPRRWLVGRFVRIYPLHMCFIFVAATAWMINPSMTMGSGEQTWGSVIRSFFIIPQDGLPIVFVVWTLEHEIVFYLLVFFIAALGGSARTLVGVTGALSALAALRYCLKDTFPALNFWDYHFLSLFMIEFTIGASLYLFRDVLKPLGYWLPAFIALALFVAGGFLPIPGGINSETLPRILVFGGSYGLFLLAGFNFENYLRGKRGSAYPPARRPFMVSVGDASYSIYLMHPFCLSFGAKILRALHVEGAVAIVAIIAGGVATLFAGIAFHRLVESPFLQAMKPLTSGRKTKESRE